MGTFLNALATGFFSALSEAVDRMFDGLCWGFGFMVGAMTFVSLAVWVAP